MPGFVVHRQSPVYLQTDASDYGIGGFLFQLVDGVVRPVEFLSKTLSKAQRRWSTPDKEAYAIIYCLKRWDYLLRDVRQSQTLEIIHSGILLRYPVH